MKKTNRTRSDHRYIGMILVLSVAPLSGCGHSTTEQAKWILGSHLFLFWALSLMALMVLQRLHKWSVFISLIEKVKTPASILGASVSVLGVWFVVVGIPKLFAKPAEAQKLTSFLGVMVLVSGVHLYRWARAPSPGEKATALKVSVLSVAYGLGLLYILSGVGLLVPT